MAHRRANPTDRPIRPGSLWSQIISDLEYGREEVHVGHDGEGVFITCIMKSIFGATEAIYGFKTQNVFLKEAAKFDVTINDFLSEQDLDAIERDLVGRMRSLGLCITCNSKFTVFTDQFDREHNCLEVTVPANAKAIQTFIHAVVNFEGEYHNQETEEPSADGAAAATPAQELTTKPLTKLQLAKRELDQLAEEEATLNAALAAAERAEKEAKEAARLEAEQAVELEKTRAEIAARKQAMAEKQAKLAALKSATQSDTWHTPKNAVKLNEATPTPTPEGALPKNSFAVLAVEPEQGASWA